MLSTKEIVAMPKIMLHDHIDGGMRTTTLIELAKEIGYDKLAETEPEALQQYILTQSRRKKLELYLETFDHTLAVMQTPASIERVAYECGEDLANDGVVYAESRLAPQLFTLGSGNGFDMVGKGAGLNMDEAMEAFHAGFARAEKDFGIVIRILCCSMKQFEPTTEVAEIAVKYSEHGNGGMVVGFDLAGPEAGFLCSAHQAGINTALDGGLGLTLHAGEAAGMDSVADAVECGAQRLGHGVRIMDNVSFENDEDGKRKYFFGELAQGVRDRQIPLEVCPTSNIHTGICETFETHPILMLHEAGFAVTLNTDNRLMSDITLSQEFQNCQEAFGWDKAEFEKFTQTALKASFCPDSIKETLL